jgi:tRNA 2-selenouridine synthase
MNLEAFLKLPGPLYDVRSPGEFLQGTIPNSLNLPLFSDAERAEVGTVYKQVNPQDAYLLGLKFAGPKLANFVAEGLKTTCNHPTRLFCFRGGQRSGSMQWLFQSAGISTITLKGGYKAFRRFVLETFAKPYELKVLGGLTGSGKTEHLLKLKSEGEQIIDLEALAKHRGSAFGRLGRQPSTESFENSLACALFDLDAKRPIWIEDESRLIGYCKIPDLLYAQMQKAPFSFLESSKSDRINRLVQDYGHFPKPCLIQATQVLSKRLGAVRTKEIIAFIQEEHFQKAASLLLDYYDRTYLYSLEKNKRIRV